MGEIGELQYQNSVRHAIGTSSTMDRLSFLDDSSFNEYDAISLMAGPEVRSVLRNMIPIF